VHRKVPAGFGGRLRGKGPHPPSRTRDLAAQPIRFQERDSRLAPAGPTGADESDGDPGADAGPGGDNGPGSGPDGGPGGNNGPGPQAGPTGPARPSRPDHGLSVAALINLTVPLATALGQSTTPGEAAGYGPLEPDDVRALLAAAARHPDTRWCVTALHPDGTAAAHGCARGRHPPPLLPGPASPASPTGDPPGPDPPPGTFHPTGTGSPPGPDPPPATGAPDYLATLRIQMTPVARGHCDHTRAETGYQPSRTLAHLIKVRNTRCTAPGCGQPAARCDLDHTLAWDNGGLTCECDLAPLCRHNHRAKQAQGWHLAQPQPGVLHWRTPAGRTYTTTPTSYPTLGLPRR
jgi:hypothetical protein